MKSWIVGNGRSHTFSIENVPFVSKSPCACGRVCHLIPLLLWCPRIPSVWYPQGGEAFSKFCKVGVMNCSKCDANNGAFADHSVVIVCMTCTRLVPPHTCTSVHVLVHVELLYSWCISEPIKYPMYYIVIRRVKAWHVMLLGCVCWHRQTTSRDITEGRTTEH